MKDKIFIDTNVFVYAYLENPKKRDEHEKHLKAKELLRSFTTDNIVFISTQVCNEYYSALLKNKIENSDIQSSLYSLLKLVPFSPDPFSPLECIIIPYFKKSVNFS